jgi:CheY-like chemotaxis protein
LNNIPSIILVTAYGKEGLMRQADEIGLEGFLLKPVSSSMLFDAVMQAFGKPIQDQSRISREKEKVTDWEKAIAGARVLLVEDNEINQQVAMEILQGAGLNVTVANNGQEGVDAARQNEFDAILMDIQMPVMDGYAASREIRKWEGERRNAEVGLRPVGTIGAYAPEGMRNKMGEDSDLKSKIQNPKSNIDSVPIIAMTAHAMAGDEKKSIQAGMNDHVTKPIDPDQLFTTLQKWIKPDAKQALSQNQQPQILESQSNPDQAIPHEDELPKVLPGFDLKAGLMRLMGNKILYRKLLLDFGANYGGAASEIRKALAAGDFEQAHSLVHNLKGLAGNLEANDLHVAAVEMETLVKGQTAKTTSDKDLNWKFAELENTLGQALDAVQTLGPTADKKTIASSKEAIASVPRELIQKITESIKPAVDLGDVMKIKSIAEELKSESDTMAPFCNELVQLAEDFDFDGIQKFILELNI